MIFPPLKLFLIKTTEATAQAHAPHNIALAMFKKGVCASNKLLCFFEVSASNILYRFNPFLNIANAPSLAAIRFLFFLPPHNDLMI